MLDLSLPDFLGIVPFVFQIVTFRHHVVPFHIISAQEFESVRNVFACRYNSVRCHFNRLPD